MQDLIGKKLEDALAILKDAGISNVSVTETKSFRSRGDGAGLKLVIQVREHETGVELIVSDFMPEV